MSLTEFLQILSIIGSVSGLVCAGIVYCWKHNIRPFVIEQTSDPIVALAITATAKIVHDELTMNGGGSMKDAVSKIGPNHLEAKKEWTEIKRRLTNIDSQMLANMDRLAAIEGREDWSAVVMEEAFKHAPAEQQVAVTELIKRLPAPERRRK